MVKKLKSPRRLAVLAIFAIVAMSVFGFAAANTVAPSNAGDGQAAVSGGAVTNVHYTLDANGDITAVSFDYGSVANPTQGFVELLGAGGTVLVSGSCVSSIAYDFVCSLSAAQPVLPVEGLRVVTAS